MLGVVGGEYYEKIKKGRRVPGNTTTPYRGC
jgi:hypothetical protein